MSVVSAGLPRSIFPMAFEGNADITIAVRPEDAREAERLIESHRVDDSGGRVVPLRNEFADLVEDMIGMSSPAEMVPEAYRRRSEAGDDLDLPDPFRRPPDVHRQVADQIATAVRIIAERLSVTVQQ
jgi:hypothetical protein